MNIRGESMKYKLIPMKDGKVDLSLNELSEMLENAYNDGFKDGANVIVGDLKKMESGSIEPYIDSDTFRVHYEKPNAVWYGPDWTGDWPLYKQTTTKPDYGSITDYVTVNSDTYTTGKDSNDTTTAYNGENTTFTKILEDLLKK